MTLRVIGFAALLMALVVLGMVMVSGHGTTRVEQGSTTQLCRDVGEFSQTITDIRSGGLSTEQVVARLGRSRQAFVLDSQREQDPVIASHAVDLSTDITEWMVSLVSGDPVEEDIAINRTLSELVSIPPC